MDADEIFGAIFKFGHENGVAAVLPKYAIEQHIIGEKERALEELRHLVAIRDDTDTAYPEKPLHNDKC